MAEIQFNISEFLSRISPFSQLPPAVLNDLAARMQPLGFGMGKKMMEVGKLPGQVLVLCQGQIRLLGYNTRTQMPMTLERMQPGAVLGAVSLMRGVGCETAIASTDAVCLPVSAEEFLRLMGRYTEFALALQNKCSPIEALELLDAYLNKQAWAGTEARQLAIPASENALVRQVPPGRSTLGDLHGDRIWLLGSGVVRGMTIGDELSLTNNAPVIQVEGDKPARLIGFRPQDVMPTASALVAAVSDPSGTSGMANGENRSIGQSRVGSVLIPSFENVPQASDDLPEYDPETGKAINYPLIRATGKQESTLACFQMLSQYFKIPFRREAIRRVVSNHISRTEAVSLQTCGSIADLMGLNAQLVTVPTIAIGQIPTPAMLLWQGVPAILYRASDRDLMIASPEQGTIHCKPADAFAELGDTTNLLLLQATKETPKQTFGLSWFLPFLREYRRPLLEVLVASFFVQLFGLANPLMIQVIIDKVLVQNSPDTLQVLGILLLVVAVFEAVLGSLRMYLFTEITNRIDMKLGSEIIDHLLRLPLRYFDRRPVGELATRVNELENIRQFMTTTALTVVLDSVFSVVYIVVMFIYSWVLTLVALATIPLFAVLTLVATPIMRRQLRDKAERNAETQSHLVEVLTGIQTVKAQNIELRSRWRWQEHYARYVSAGFKTVLTSTAAGSASNFLSQFSGLLVLWVGAYLVLKQDLTLGQLIAFRIIAGYVTQPLLRLVQLWQNFQQTALSLERLADIVDTPQEIDAIDRNNIPMPTIRGAVTYENVSFRFSGTGPMQINNVDLSIPAGAFVGIVGQSGSGKSTLMKLLPRLYEVNGGRILIDGYDISKVELYSLRSQVGLVPQEPLLFDGTVQENIGLTVPDAPTDDIIEAAKLAVAHDFIMGLSSGYNTRVGERGASLSGGQRQRIAIARTILQNPELLVLDEATSALDYDTERQVCQNLITAFRGRTIFFITHRLRTIQSADIILVMDRGSVVEQGTHDELLAQKGRYYCLYQQQEVMAV
jgi:ATP-binding cassette subfamily B protein